MNKYEQWYKQLVSKAKDRNWTKTSAPCYVENHHIIPKSLGGTDDDFNLVFLTAREHVIAHLMLCKFGNSNQKTKMNYAMARFMYSTKSKINSRIYESIKSQISEIRKENMIGNKHLLNHKHSEETKRKMSIKRIGVPKSDQMKYLLSEKMKITLNSKPVMLCPYCNVSSINQSNMTRWHFDKCKEKYNV